MNPIAIFQDWFQEEIKLTQAKIPGACCLSTMGLDNYPNARFVSLKEIVNDCFIITGPLNSRKGLEINRLSKVALTFWWTNTERQVRIQGNAAHIPEQLADKYFAERNKDSQIVSIISKQGQEILDMDELTEKYNQLEKTQSSNSFIRPLDWGGYSVSPIRIEFLEFEATRFHNRKLYEMINGQWVARQLQP